MYSLLREKEMLEQPILKQRILAAHSLTFNSLRFPGIQVARDRFNTRCKRARAVLCLSLSELTFLILILLLDGIVMIDSIPSSAKAEPKT